MPSKSHYDQIIEGVFSKRYVEGSAEVPFVRDDIIDVSAELGLPRPGNIGDVMYSFRYRKKLPQAVLDKAPADTNWIIRGTGRATYSFVAVPGIVYVEPREGLLLTKVPDATPEIIRANALGDEQALLALVRYNRLVDIFLGLTTYSLQNHLRTTAAGSQVETDEVYLAVDRYGVQYVLPTQAKGGSDILGRIQVEQDIAMCAAKFPHLVMRAVAAQFMAKGIALFEVTVHDNRMVVVNEAHYELVPYDQVTDEDRLRYRQTANVPPRPSAV